MITIISVRIYFEDTDFSGFVYHSNYLKYFERGRTEALRELGFEHRKLFEDEDPLVFTVRAIHIDFAAPAHIDDLLTIETTMAEMRGARIEFLQRALRGNDVIAEARVTVASLNVAGRPKRLPREMIQALTRKRASTD